MAEDITDLVHAVDAGEPEAFERLYSRVYHELKLIARKQLRGNDSPTFDTTGLVHDAYLKLSHPEELDLHSRKHFFALAARAMRQIVVDHARARVASKRGSGEARMVQLDSIGELNAAEIAPERLLLVNSALVDMEAQHPRLSALIEMRLFGGLDLREIAELQSVSERTVNRDWRRARAELYAAIYS